MALPDWISGFSRQAILQSGEDSHHQWGMDRLAAHCGAFAAALAGNEHHGRPVGLIADNGADWIAADLASHLAGATLVPLPDFFSRAQLQHAVAATGMQILLCADARLAHELGFGEAVLHIGGVGLHRSRRPAPLPESAVALAVQKITFTSGTTGDPKGVCLSTGQQLQAARALALATARLGITRHLSLLPLPVLLENIAGVYAPLMAGATCVCPALAETGLQGSSSFDPARCLEAVARYQPDSIILLPQMLQALVARLSHDGLAADPRIRSLKLVAVGGGRTPVALIRRARVLGLPVYEGYGLSECASVVTLNLPGADRPGSVGRALPGTLLRLSPAGEIEVSGRTFSGYLGQSLPAEPVAAEWLATGDLGAIDEEGYVSIIGRTRNVIITGYGRNVCPEWPESLLLESPAIAQAIVFGEARPMLVAAIVPASPGISDATIDAALARANAQLPDYARVGAWLRLAEPFSPANGLATTNGRMRRDRIRDRHAGGLDALYQTDCEHP